MKIGIFLLFGLLLTFTPVHGAETGRTGPAFSIGTWNFELDPGHRPYPEYLADPRRMRFALGVAGFDSDISESSGMRAMLDAAVRYTLFRVETGGGRDFALEILGGVFLQFDMGEKLDSIGYDGLYGANLVFGINDRWTTRLCYRHLSAHIGDEYVERTGRERVGYTREDLAIGVAWQFHDRWLAYVEPGWATRNGNRERQADLSFDGGLQYEGPRRLWNDSSAFYAGLHVRAFEESDWKPGISVQTGFHVRGRADRTNVRMGLEAYTGRAILGEYALDFDESYLLASFMLDFY